MYERLPKKLVFVSLVGALCLHAGALPDNTCRRPPAGSAVPEPEDLRSRNGVLKVDLTIHNSTEGGSTRYCYIDGNGNQSPNLRLKPGDLLILHLKNDLTDPDPAAAKRAFNAMMQMRNINIAAIEAALRG